MYTYLSSGDIFQPWFGFIEGICLYRWKNSIVVIEGTMTSYHLYIAEESAHYVLDTKYKPENKHLVMVSEHALYYLFWFITRFGGIF